MEKRVKIFKATWLEDIEWQINDFFITTPGEMHEVKYLHHHAENEDIFSVLIIFTPEVENGQKSQGTKQSEKGDGGIQGKNLAFRKQTGTVGRV
jgi:hypothetical protein